MEAGDYIYKEIEIKLRLETFTDYLKLMGFLGQSDSEIRQITAFFDTEDRKLSELGWALRVRTEDQRGLITTKGTTTGPGVAAIREEIEAEISRGEALDIIELRSDVMTYRNEPIDFVREQVGDVRVARLAHFENIRKKKSFRFGDYDYTLEIDKTEFSDGSCDYELELELPSEDRIDVVEHGLRRMFAKLGIPFEVQTESKFARALKRAGMDVRS